MKYAWRNRALGLLALWAVIHSLLLLLRFAPPKLFDMFGEAVLILPLVIIVLSPVIGFLLSCWAVIAQPRDPSVWGVLVLATLVVGQQTYFWLTLKVH